MLNERDISLSQNEIKKEKRLTKWKELLEYAKSLEERPL
jgi:hypothetical protein